MNPQSPPYESREDVYEAIRTILQAGPIPRQQAGSSGIGRTLKAALGIESSSSVQTDTQYGNIKARTDDSMRTLFSKEPPREHRTIWNDDLHRQCGYRKGGEWKLYTTITTEPGSNGMFLSFTDEAIVVGNEDYGEVARYPDELLESKFQQRLPGLFLVDAEKDAKGLDYQQAEHLFGLKPYGKIKNLFRENVLKIDYRNGSTYGTAFRIDNDSLDCLFQNRRTIN